MVFTTRTARRFATGALISFAAGSIPMSVLADEVTLKSADGTVNLVGEFVDFKDDTYIIRTGLGDLRIAASRVRCEGDACPTFETAEANVVIAGSGTVGNGMMPLLISGYASHLDAEASVVSDTASTVSCSGAGSRGGMLSSTSAASVISKASIMSS